MSELKSSHAQRSGAGWRGYASAALAVVAFFCLTALALGAHRLLKSTPTTEEVAAPKPVRRAVAAAPAPAPATDGDAAHVRRGQLWPQLHGALTAAGDRLEKPGKERLTLAGTITRGAGSPPTPLSVVRDYPDRMRVEEAAGSARRVIVFDGKRTQGEGGGLSAGERDALETLLYDTADHFFHGQQSGAAATRFLGPRFRLGEATDAEHAGHSYDVFETTEPVMTDDAERVQTRRYYFNSDTRLLERVRYDVERDGARVGVEVILGGWRSVNGQTLPSSVVRLEDGAAVLSINFALMNAGPKTGAINFGL